MEDPITQPETPAMDVEKTLEAQGVEEGDSSSASDVGLKKDKPTDVLEGVDEEPLFIDAPMREFTYAGGIFSKQPLAFNPLTSFIGIAVLWGISIW